ncbi:sigma factor for late transcription [Synechococcus phage S-BM3]|nr:sigma factor for late transcription [Synechococcus phage S-BM3]
MAAKPEHYVNNKQFLEAMIVYRSKVVHARENDLPKPRITNYIGECFLKIANHLSYRPNFVNYMFKDDMICDGVENCVQYVDNFDPNKSNNPFAYFTQIIYYAFLRRIQREKKQLEIKNKIIERSGFDQVFTADSNDVGYDISDMNTIKENVEVRMNR